MQQERVQPLPPAAAILGQRLAQPRAVAQLLDLLRRDPRRRQHLLRQQPRQPTRVQAVRLRAAPAAEKRASTTSPVSGSSTAAWKACLWMSIAANITDLLS